MKRLALLTILVGLVLGMATAVAGSPAADCGGAFNPPCTPVPSGGNNIDPGDPDGDGIPNGIDQCPDQGGPASKQGCPPGTGPSATPLPQPTAQEVSLPAMPVTGDCVVATRSTEGVNIRLQPSVSTRIVGVLDPQMTYVILAQLDNAEGLWDRIVPGWVARRVVRQGGDCETVPKLDQPDATDPTPNRLSFPDGFALSLDKGDGSGQDTPQGYCASSFGVDWPTFDGGGQDAVNFDFGDGSWCIQINADGRSFGLKSPPQPDTQPFSINFSVGFNPDDTSQPILIGLLNFTPGEQAPPDPDKPGVRLAWTLFPPDPCNQGDQSCPGGQSVAVNFMLVAQNDAANPDALSVSLFWQQYPPDPCKTGDQSCPNQGAITQGVFVNFIPPVDPGKVGDLTVNFVPAIQNLSVDSLPDGLDPSTGGFILIENQPSASPGGMYGFILIENQPLGGEVTVNFTVPAL